jgi:uncharacterized protein (TIGR02145 family)
MKTIYSFILFFNLSIAAFSQVFTYNGGYSIGVNTGTAVYQYTKVNGKEIKNGTFSFIDKVNNYNVSGSYSNDKKIGDWTEVRKSFTYNDWPIVKSNLIMAKVLKSNPYKETTETIKSKYSSDNSHTEIETKVVQSMWGYPSEGKSDYSITVKRGYNSNNELISIEGSYTDAGNKKSSFKGALKDGYGVGNWEIMDRPGYTDIFKFENFRIASRTRIDNLTKKTIETVVSEANTQTASSENDYKEQYKITINKNDGILSIKEISPGIYTYKLVEYLKSKASFKTIDMSFMNRTYESMLPSGFPNELALKETSGFPTTEFRFNNICDEINYYSNYIGRNVDKCNSIQKIIPNIKAQTSIAVAANAPLFVRNMTSWAYTQSYSNYETIIIALNLLAMYREHQGYLELNDKYPGEYDEPLQSFEKYNDSLLFIIKKRYFEKYSYSQSEIDTGELWKDILYKKSKGLKDCDSTMYSAQFEYLNNIFTEIDSSVSIFNEKNLKSLLSSPTIKVGNLEFLARDLNLYPKETSSVVLYTHDNYSRVQRVNDLASPLLFGGDLNFVYSPNSLITDPCPKGYRIPTVEEWRELQNTLDGNFDLIKSGGPLNFNSDFMCLSGGSDDYFFGGSMNFLVYNDFKSPRHNKYKFLYFSLTAKQNSEFNPNILESYRPEYVKCRCIKEK